MTLPNTTTFKTAAVFAALIGTFFWCANPSSAACAAKRVVAGVVVSVAESDGTLYLLRDGKMTAVYVAQVVCDGDKVGPLGGKGKIGVQRADGKVAYFSPKPKQNIVRSVGTNSKGWALIVNWLRDIVPQVEPYSVMTIGRDMPSEKLAFEIQSLSQKRALIASGHTGLFVRWKGGIGPFTLQIADAQGAKIAELTGIPGSAAYLDARRNLESGHWTVTLKDTAGAELVGEFAVDASRKFDSIAEKTPFAELDIAASAVRLAADPQWTLEADQMFFAAPHQGLDRRPIYRVIGCKSYTSNQPDDCQ